MKWIHNYQLFLFDFDGLLVNTEEIHYLAYKKMFAGRGIDFSWDFNRYCQAAHYDAHALRNQMYAEFPHLHALEPKWEVLYAEKKQALRKLLEEGAVHMMPGAEKLLLALKAANIKRCVVTHSPDDIVQLIRRKNPVLDTIPSWITRENYSHPKPHSECYLKAVELMAQPNDRIIGFEDSPRGLTALMGAPGQAVLICRVQYPEIPSFVQRGALHYPSLDSIPDHFSVTNIYD